MGYNEAFDSGHPTVCDQCYSVVLKDDQENHDQAVHGYETTTLSDYNNETIIELRTPKKWAQPIVHVDRDKCYHPENS